MIGKAIEDYMLQVTINGVNSELYENDITSVMVLYGLFISSFAYGNLHFCWVVKECRWQPRFIK